jgi:DNA-binding PadR family transcriptional regulator
MDERALLLLGILKAQSLHGYQINEFIERNLSRVTDMKRATAYSILDRLSRGGFVSVQSEQVGNRPTRKVYTITDSGEELFLSLLRENLQAADRPALSGDIGLMFLDELPRDEVLISLRERLARLEQRIEIYQKAPPHGHGLGVDLSIDHMLHLLRADHAWLERAIDGIASAAPEIT